MPSGRRHIIHLCVLPNKGAVAARRQQGSGTLRSVTRRARRPSAGRGGGGGDSRSRLLCCGTLRLLPLLKQVEVQRLPLLVLQEETPL